MSTAQGVAFDRLCHVAGLPVPVPEYLFHAERRWRFDWCWPTQGVALEVEGGIWTTGRHVRAKGYLADLEKYNAAAVTGWLLLRTTPEALATSATLELVREALALRDQTLALGDSTVLRFRDEGR